MQAMAPLACPECGSTRLYRDGLRYLADGSQVQRWLCRNCGYRFSESSLNNCQTNMQSDAHQKAVKLLVEAEKALEKREAGATETSQADVKGKILNFLLYLKRQGYSEETLKFYNRVLRIFSEKTNLMDCEAVKDCLAKMAANETTKCNYSYVLQAFYKFNKIIWESPKYKPQKSIPFIPTEQELDLLIANTSKMLSALLQLLKETGMRVGEALKLKWTDVDFENKTVRVKPEKGSLPRILPLSDTALAMVKRLKPRADGMLFGSRKNVATAFFKQRKRLAFKLNNPRLLQISFHTFRHWKATMEYHKTKDILHVQKILGHRNIQNTLIYITVEQALWQSQKDEFHVKTAKTVEEACKLVEVGFEYVCEVEGVKIFRKRK